MDDSSLTEIEKERIMNKRTGKTKSQLLKIDISIDKEDEENEESFDISSIIETEMKLNSEENVGNDDLTKKKPIKGKIVMKGQRAEYLMEERDNI